VDALGGMEFSELSFRRDILITEGSRFAHLIKSDNIEVGGQRVCSSWVDWWSSDNYGSIASLPENSAQRLFLRRPLNCV